VGFEGIDCWYKRFRFVVYGASKRIEQGAAIPLRSIAASELCVGKAVKFQFTKKQGQYLAYIYHYTQINRHPPAEADIQRYFRVTPPTVHQMILKLEENGLIQRVPRQARTIRVLLPPEELPQLSYTGI
jgi:repressor LexA